MVTEKDVRRALRKVKDPELNLDLVVLGLVYDIEVQDTHVKATVSLTSPFCPVAGQILENKGLTFGYNAQSGEYGDMITMGIVDPVKVVRTALQDAASVAGLLVTTEAMIAEAPKKDAPMPAGMPGGGMGGMGGMDF